MAAVSVPAMRRFLRETIASFNENKLKGLLAEVDLRRHLQEIGFADRVSPGGWILRKKRQDFGRSTVVLFPETIQPATDYSADRPVPQPSLGLHTVCATFHQTGIQAFFCSPIVARDDDTDSIEWRAVQLGIPMARAPIDLLEAFRGLFIERDRAYNFRRYDSDTNRIPERSVPEEFSKEHLLVTFSSEFFAEVSDVDGIFWGEQFTYPLEIKEKTAFTNDTDIGDWFGLDVGPFVKLAFYAAKRGNLHSLFVVREIDSEERRNLVEWWFITYERLAQFASWTQRGGGRGMRGGASSVIRIPKAEFQPLNRQNLERL